MNTKNIDEQIMKLASSQKLYLSDEYNNLVKNKTDYMLKRSVEMRINIKRMAVAFVTISILLCGSIGVYASKNYISERIESVSDEKKQQYINDLLGADASIDTYSRELTDEENKRLKKLIIEYESEGKFPVGEVLQISDETEVVEDRVCFFAKESKFFIPEFDLTDEDLLEIIDFYYIREYSLMEKETNETKYPVDFELDEEKLVDESKDLISRIFDIDISKCKVSYEHNSGNDGNRNFTELYVKLLTEDGACYNTCVDMQTGKIVYITVDYEKSNYCGSISVDDELCESKLVDAQKIVSEFSDEFGNADKKIQYMVDDNNVLYKGIVNFIFESDEKVSIVSYSYVNNNFYAIRTMNKEQYEIWKQDKEKQCKENNLMFELK